MMQVFKCRICGEPYMGNAKLSHCSFCGASDNYMVFAKDWVEIENVDLSDKSKANLEHALLMENNSALFYACSFEISMNLELSAMFEVLWRMEAKHVSLIRYLLGIPKPEEEEDNRGRCHALEQLNVTDARERENRAIEFYSQAAADAVEPRVKELFLAFAEIEASHLGLIKDAESHFLIQSDIV